MRDGPEQHKGLYKHLGSAIKWPKVYRKGKENSVEYLTPIKSVSDCRIDVLRAP